jgi:hypothetical protein
MLEIRRVQVFWTFAFKVPVGCHRLEALLLEVSYCKIRRQLLQHILVGN